MKKYLQINIKSLYLSMLTLSMEERGVLITAICLINENVVNWETYFNEHQLNIINHCIPKIEMKCLEYKGNIYGGDKHWNWKGGITSENGKIRNSKEYKNWRMSVFSRDKFQCQICRKVGGDIEAHHIESFSKNPKKRFIINNGITLCKECHKKLHQKKGGTKK